MFPAVSDTSAEQLLLSLDETLIQLRQSWPEKWPGLAVVFAQCWRRLGHGTQGLDDRTQALLFFATLGAEHIEKDGQARASNGREPEYHNRLHMADSLACMTHLLLALRAQNLPGTRLPHLEALMLVIMLGHDYLHPGGNNAFPMQLERIAVDGLLPLMAQSGLYTPDCETVQHCILMTDPSSVKPTHQAISGRPFSLEDRDWMCILAQEADIMASTLPNTQQSLTQSLSNEWQHTNPEAAAKLLLPNSRLFFLEHAALFSSPAAQYLGLNDIKSRQINALQNKP